MHLPVQVPWELPETHLDQVCQHLGTKGGRAGLPVCLKQETRVSPHKLFGTVVATQDLPCSATTNSQEQICISPVNREALVCTIEAYDLMTIHGKLLNSQICSVLHGENNQD